MIKGVYPKYERFYFLEGFYIYSLLMLTGTSPARRQFREGWLNKSHDYIILF